VADKAEMILQPVLRYAFIELLHVGGAALRIARKNEDGVTQQAISFEPCGCVDDGRVPLDRRQAGHMGDDASRG